MNTSVTILKQFFGGEKRSELFTFPSTHWKTGYSLRGKLVKFFLTAPRRCWQDLFMWWPCDGITAHMESLRCPIFLCWPLCNWSLLSHAHLWILPPPSVRISYSLSNTIQPIYSVAELCPCLITACQPLSPPCEPSHLSTNAILLSLSSKPFSVHSFPKWPFTHIHRQQPRSHFSLFPPKHFHSP